MKQFPVALERFDFLHWLMALCKRGRKNKKTFFLNLQKTFRRVTNRLRPVQFLSMINLRNVKAQKKQA